MKISSSITFICIFISINFISSSKLLGNLDDELVEAIARGNTARLKVLLQMGVSPEAPDSECKLPPLIYAVCAARTDCVRMLLDAGANPHWKGYLPTLQGRTQHECTIIEFTQYLIDYPSISIIERLFLCSCSIKKRIRNLKEIIGLLTTKMEAIARLANDDFKEPESCVEK